MTRILLIVLLASCLEQNLVSCPDGRLCPQDKMCDVVHHVCITSDQQHACDGLADGAKCVFDGKVGSCEGGVCLQSVCGDGAIGPDEVCDDGNRDNGDGCNATCTSDERCGNGIVDPEKGESCDDRNAISGDGCDSQCRSEQETWTIEGITPRFNNFSAAVYDPVHHQVVYVIDGMTWTWDGAKWSLLEWTELPRGSWDWYEAIWDPDHEHVLFFGAFIGAGGLCPCKTDQVWSWDGTSWTRIAVTGSFPAYDIGHVVYDRARHVVLAIFSNYSTMYTMAFDPATATWSTLAVTSGSVGNVDSFAYDSTRDVAVHASPPSTTAEWNGTSWSQFTTATPNFARLTYDATLGAVVRADDSGLAKWSGGSWVAVDTTRPLGMFPHLWFDPDRQRLVAFESHNDIFEHDGSQWTGPLRSGPSVLANSNGTFYAYDPPRHELVTLVMGGSGEDGASAWAYDGAWRTLPALPVAPPVAPIPVGMAYDPVRRGIVVREYRGGTWLLQGDAWTQLTATTVSDYGGMTYDPSRRAVVSTLSQGMWQLASEGDQWSQFAPTAPGSSGYLTMAFDARSNQLFALSGSAAQRLDPGGWTTDLSALDVTLATDQRRGTIELVGPSQAYERVSGQWFPRTKLPLAIDGVTVYGPDTGTLYVIGDVGFSARVMLRRRFVGPSPVDACTGNDDDGDGLVDCADPECWWKCAPACPPYATCP